MPCTAHLTSISPGTSSGSVSHLFCFSSKLSFFFPIYKKGQKGELQCIGNQHYFLLHLKPAAKHNKHIQCQLGSLPLPHLSHTWPKKEEKQLKGKYSGVWGRMPGRERVVSTLNSRGEQQNGVCPAAQGLPGPAPGTAPVPRAPQYWGDPKSFHALKCSIKHVS